MDRTRTRADMEAQLERLKERAANSPNNSEWYRKAAEAVEKELAEWSR